MFTCSRCGEEKPDGERGSVGWWAQIVLFIFCWLPGAWASPLCKDCTWGYRFIGAAFLVFVAVAILFFALMKFFP
jgi:hypothetical protein